MPYMLLSVVNLEQVCLSTPKYSQEKFCYFTPGSAAAMDLAGNQMLQRQSANILDSCLMREKHACVSLHLFIILFFFGGQSQYHIPQRPQAVSHCNTPTQQVCMSCFADKSAKIKPHLIFLYLGFI